MVVKLGDLLRSCLRENIRSNKNRMLPYPILTVDFPFGLD